MEIFDTQRVEQAVICHIVVADGKVFGDFSFHSFQTAVRQFQFRNLTGNLFGFFGFGKVFSENIVGTQINIQHLFRGDQIAVGDTHLRHDGDRLSVTAVFIGIDLCIISHITGDLTGQSQKIVCGTDTDFHPAVVIKEAVVAVGEINKHPHVGEHGNDGLAALQHIDVFLHVDFKQFGAFHQGDLFHQLHFRQGKFGDGIQHGIINPDHRIGVKSQQGAQLNTAVFVSTDIIFQTFFHFDETAGFIKGTERSDLTGSRHLFDQFIAVFALFQQFGGDFDRPLGSGNLEVDPHRFQHQILFGTAGVLLTEQHPVIRLTGVEKGKTEIHHTQRQIDIQIVDRAILTLTVRVGSRAVTIQLTALGCRSIILMVEVVGNIEFRQHTEDLIGAHLFGNLLFQTENFQIQIVGTRQSKALVERQHFAFRNIGIAGALKVGNRFGKTLFLIIIKRFTAGKAEYTGSDNGD